MQRENWNRDWYFWKVNDSFAIGNGIPESACMVNVPHDAMIGEKPFAESQNVNNTGFRDSSVYKYAKKLMVPSEEKDKLIFLKFEDDLIFKWDSQIDRKSTRLNSSH